MGYLQKQNQKDVVLKTFSPFLLPFPPYPPGGGFKGKEFLQKSIVLENLPRVFLGTLGG